MSEEEVHQLTLPPALSSARAARRRVRQALSDWGLSELAETAMLLTTEVVTNSVLHARTTIVLTIVRRAEGGVRIGVRDHSHHLPVRRRHTHDSTTGRGLQLLDRLADSWAVESDPGGKTVSFCVTSSAGGRGDP